MSSLWQSSLQAMDKLQNCFMTQLGDRFVKTILYHHEKQDIIGQWTCMTD